MNKKILFGILVGIVIIIAISVALSYQKKYKMDAIKRIETVGWLSYKSDEADFTFKYPSTWEIREDYLYETGGETKARHRTVVLCDQENEKNSFGDYSRRDCIQINTPQALENEKTKIIGENYLNLYTDDPAIVKIYETVFGSFRDMNELVK